MLLNIVRHGQSIANTGKGITPNDGLSDLGERQAAWLAEYYKDIPVTHMFSSAFLRVIQTAAPTASVKNIQLVLIPELSEIFNAHAVHRRDFPYDSCAKMEQDYPFAKFTEHHDRNLKWWPDWPETQEVEVTKRVNVFYQRELVPLLDTDAHVIVFGHGATTAALRRFILPEDTHEPENAVIFACELDKDGKCIDHQLIEPRPTSS